MEDTSDTPESPDPDEPVISAGDGADDHDESAHPGVAPPED